VAAAAWWWSQRPAPAISMAAIAEDGSQSPLADELWVAPDQHRVRVAIGGDRVGLASRSTVRVLRRDRKVVRLRLDRGAVAAHVSHRDPGSRSRSKRVTSSSRSSARNFASRGSRAARGSTSSRAWSK